MNVDRFAAGEHAANTVTGTLTPGTTAVRLWSPSQGRLVAILSGVTNGQVTISPQPGVNNGAGIVIQQGDPPLVLSRVLHL